MYIARTNLGGKIDPSGPVPPKPGVSGRRAVGLNRNPVTVAWSTFWDEMGFCTFFLGVIYNFAILYLTGTELLKTGDSGNCWDVVRDRTSTGLRLEPGVKVGLSPGFTI